MTNQFVRFCEGFDGTRIAYALSGDGPPVVLLPSWLTHLQYQRRSAAWRPWIEALEDRYRLLRFDPRGCGLSDKSPGTVTFDAWVRDLGALVAHVGFQDYTLIGSCQGGAVAIEFAARNPGLVSRLVLFGTYARGRDKRGDIPLEPDKAKAMLDMIRLGWGDEAQGFTTAFAKQFQPDGGEAHLLSWCRLQRMAATPQMAADLTRLMFGIDIQTALSVIMCPTLVAHSARDAVVPVEEGRRLAQAIRGARYFELDSSNHFLRADEPAWQDFVRELHVFLPQPAGDSAAWQDLTPREREVLDGICQGLDNRQIAQRLGISEKTVRNHASNLFATLGVSNRAQAIVKARDGGFG